MKNLLICGLLTAGCCLSAGAQSKINGPGRHMIEEFKERAAVSRGLTAPQTMVIVSLEQGATASDIAALGHEVVSDFGDMLIVSLPLDKIEAFAALDEVRSVSFGTQSVPLLNVARAQTGVDLVQTGTGEGLNGVSYTGKGVVCGLYDTGLDPNHPAFKTADGTSRVKGVYVMRGYSEGSVQCTSYTTPQQIASFTTEDEHESHGTHVLGCIAGSQGVVGNFGEVNSAGGVNAVTDQPIPYYGSAINADLLVGCGDFYDASILAGVDKIVNEAVAMGKPAVVNLSLGNNSGSHDENDHASKILDRLGQKAIICIAAGNEGQNNMAITKKFGGISGKVLNTFIIPQRTPKNQLSYTAQFWSNNTDPFTCKVILYTKLDGGKIVKELTIPANGGSVTFDSGIPEFAASYTGTLRASGSLDREANRYCVTITGNYQQTGADLYIGVNITAGDEMATNRGKIDAYINTSRNYPTMTFASENVAGYLNGSPNGSINGMGCGKNILSVGAYVSRTSWPLANGTMGSWNNSGSVGEVASFSSYGTTNDDRSLPHCVAPGSQIVAPISSYWYKSQKMSQNVLAAYQQKNGNLYPYYNMEGTSMATPFAAGVVALWLEAWPEMTIKEVQSIIAMTSTVDASLSSALKVRYGAGKINALEGMKKAIAHSASINTVLNDNADKNLIYEILPGKNVEVTIPGINGFDAALYNLSGAKVAANATDGEALTLDGSALTEGVYVLSAQTPAGPVSKKIELR